MEILAAGGVVWRNDGDQRRVFLVHRPRYDDWSLPKGKLRKREHPVVTAHREVHEETGLRAALERRLPRQRYFLDGVPKTVAYWAMRAESGEFRTNAEVDGGEWLEVSAAEDRLTYTRDRAVLEAFAGGRSATCVVLLVRHASAGSHSDWSGADRSRPLDARGRRQAAQLRAALWVWHPLRVHAADRLRCRQTVDGVAEDLGVQVRKEECLTEDACADDLAAGIARLRAIGGRGQTSVVCSQGGAIPALIEAIAFQDGVRLRRLAAAKGSVWALCFDGERLRWADYYRDLAPPV